MYKKVIINFTITIVLLVLLGVTAIIKMAELADLSQKLYSHPYTVTNATRIIESNLISMHRYMKDVALSNNDKELQMAVERVNSSEIIIYKQFDVIFDRYLGDKQDIQKSYDAFVKWKSIRDEVISLMKDNKEDEAAQITKQKGAKHVENLNMQVDKLVQYAQNKAIFFNQNAIDSKNSSIILIIILLLIIVSTIIFILILLLNNISKTDKEIKKHFHIIDQNIMSATLDESFNIKEVSNAFARHLGLSKDELLKKTNNFLYSDCDKNQKDTIKRVVQSGENWDGEIKKLDNNDEIKWLHSNIQPIFNDDYNVVGYTNIFHDISSKKKIEDISNIDGLTNLYNRRFFDNIFPQQIKISQRNKSLLVFVMMDIDHFKQYNDTYGHQAGDTTLKKVASVIKKSLNRPDDYTFRLGGEEFGMLYNVNDTNEAFNVADKTRQDIESLKIEHSGNSASKFVTMSMGVYVIEIDKIYEVDDIYKSTDELLYQAKQNGRNQVISNNAITY
ncbi:MAG: diguanylate cyclase [Campylobacterota bacterium]|nr:diguanylate cyclase [Campylobacterota bacterium]